MEHFDLAIAYTWEFDEEFVNLIENYFQSRGYLTFLIKPDNVDEVIKLLESKKLHFTCLLDRASDEDVSFIPIAQILKRRKCYVINPHNKVKNSIDKALMHNRLYESNFKLPKTFILPPFEQDFRLQISEKDLESIGIPFIIKPSYFSGGGEGVFKNANNLEVIQKARMNSPTERFLVQEKILPKVIDRKRAWFRVFWAFDQVIPTWWNDRTHIYNTLSNKELVNQSFQQLKKIVSRIAAITKLDYFSTEIAITKDHKFYLIDYINDQCDMRLKSNHPDGVPDEIVYQIIELMKQSIQKNKNKR